jgi:hypothetical protein
MDTFGPAEHLIGTDEFTQADRIVGGAPSNLTPALCQFLLVVLCTA